ncbi:hypothetical protein [Inconstantimicrobium mannanitabidum]|uniref:Uncharacterized protein n=1 Tax=Inconstantimicrobium mannanitabidum TaxID=1604901 RepID=A0ACB5RF16_9CLOT|nr:hypothetical protein [Clostridium sp. TW13]GKX67678.1 hypothetical protein rsdtw13_29360 [Clostridium sp. TW13]
MANSVQENNSTSWKTIILLLIFFWPVGLILLYRKISIDKSATLKNSKTFNILGWVFVALSVISVLMILTGNLKTEDGSSTTGELMVALVFFGGGGAVMIYAAKKMKINAEKLKKYIAIIINNNQTSIDNIAAAVPISYEEAVKDLQKMIDNGYFEGAYIDVSNREIVLTNKKTKQNDFTSNVQMDGTANELQVKVVVCKSCGGNNKVVRGQVCECEYCGSLLE